MKYWLIGLFFLCSCKKEKTITYVVESPSPTFIMYTNEFGSTQADMEAAQISKYENLNWKKEFIYSPDKFGTTRTINLYAAARQDYPCYVKAKIFVNNKLVADSIMYADEEGDTSVPVSLSYDL